MAIWILAEQWRGKLSDITYELLALGREIADALNVRLEAVLLGHNVEHLAATLGAADAVLSVDDPLLAEPLPEQQAAALAQLVAARQPKAVAVPLTNVSLGVGTLLGAELSLPSINFCKGVRVGDGTLESLCVLYGGKIEARVVAAREPLILGVWPGARPADNGRSPRSPGVERCQVSLAPSRVRFKRYHEPESGDVDLTQQEALVAVGRGIQSRDNLELAEQLAAALGGAVCGSRPVIDQGWLPLSRQIGKSGLTVKPKVYVAAGVSGAPEHIEGMKEAGLIIAINSDPQAPIFNVAHYGIVGDALDILPALTEAVEARKG